MLALLRVLPLLQMLPLLWMLPLSYGRSPYYRSKNHPSQGRYPNPLSRMLPPPMHSHGRSTLILSRTLPQPILTDATLTHFHGRYPHPLSRTLPPSPLTGLCDAVITPGSPTL